MESTEPQTIAHEAGNAAQSEVAHKRDFAMPFIICSFLALPSLIIMAFARQTIGFTALEIQPFFVLVRAALWFLVPIATVSGLLFLWRSRGVIMRLAAAMLLLAVVSSFAFINLT